MSILVCYDGSPVADEVLTTGIKMGKAFLTDMYIFTSISPRKDSKEKFEFITDEQQKEIDNAKKEAEKACQIARDEGLECKAHVTMEGKDAGEDIINYAQQINAEYIVIGVRTRSRVGKLIFGSTAQWVILNSHCPVMTVRS